MDAEVAALVYKTPTQHYLNNVVIVGFVSYRQDYNKSHSTTAMKANPLGGSSMAKGIVLEKM